MLEFALEHKFCALFAEPGLGKTPTTLTLMLASLYDYCDTTRWLVVGPKLVVDDTWPRQMAMWMQFAGLSSRLLTSEQFGLRADYAQVDETTRKKVGLTFGERSDKAALKAEFREGMRETVHLCPYHLFPWLVKAYGRNVPYDGLVLDESLSVANSESDRHKAAWHMAHRLGCVSRLIELTGTPNPNNLQQLHGQIRLIDGGQRLGKTQTEFRERFMMPDKLDRKSGRVWSWKPARGAREDVQERIKDVCVALRADDWLDLPPLTINPIYVPLPAAAREMYDSLEKDLVVKTEGGKVLAPGQGVLAAKLRQIANGAVYLTERDEGHGKYLSLSDFKLDRLAELMESTSTPILLAYQFGFDKERILKRFGAAAMHVNAKGALDAFRAGNTRLLIAHASAMEGVDGLQDVCSTVIWFGATFNARHHIQTLARVRRDGSTADRIMVHQILADDTVEGYYAGEVLPERVDEQDALLNAIAWRAKR